MLLFNKIGLTAISLILISATLLFTNVAMTIQDGMASALCSMFAFVIGLFAVIVSVTSAVCWGVKA
jgi:hypothetical protein